MNMKAYVCFNGGSCTDVMEGATWDCAVAGTLNNGTEVTITAEQNGWYEIGFENSTAWIIANRVFFAKTGAVCFSGGSYTDVMESATWDCAVTGQINNGIEVCIIGEQNGWYQIFFENSTAWIPTNRVYIINMRGYVCFTGGASSDIMSEATWYSTALTELDNGTEITIVGAQNGWYQIIYGNSTAWILEDRVYLITTTGIVNFSGGSCTDVMEAATWDCAVAGQINNGTKLYIIGQQSGWYEIVFKNSTAWICVDRVSFERQGYVCFAGGSGSDIMSEATWDSTVITELNNGTEINISGEQNGWYQITFNGSTAWILASRVCIPEAGFPKIGCVDFNGGTFTYVTRNPNFNNDGVGQLNNGTKITIIGEQNGWYEILFEESTAWLPQGRVSFPRKAYIDFTTNGNTFTYVTKNPNFNNDGVGQINNGIEICIVGEEDGWYEIKFEGSTAWLPAERAFLPISGTVCYSEKAYTYVTKNPNFNNDGVGKVYNGTDIIVIAEENGWYEILFEESTAWLPTSRVNLNMRGYMNCNSSIMSNPTSTTSVGTLYNDTEVYIVGEQNGWYQIAFNDSVGWIQTQNVTVPSLYYNNSNNIHLGNGNYEAYGYNEQQYNTALEVYNYFIKEGWTNNAIIGMLGNMTQESSLNPTIWQNGDVGNMSGGVGLVQWTPASKLIDACSDWESVEAQCEFIESELRNGGQWQIEEYDITFDSYITMNDSPAQMARIFCSNFEQAGNPDTGNRIKYANEWSIILG